MFLKWPIVSLTMLQECSMLHWWSTFLTGCSHLQLHVFSLLISYPKSPSLFKRACLTIKNDFINACRLLTTAESHICMKLSVCSLQPLQLNLWTSLSIIGWLSLSPSLSLQYRHGIVKRDQELDIEGCMLSLLCKEDTQSWIISI